MPRSKNFPEEEVVRTTIILPKRLYEELWKLAAERWVRPVGKLSVLIAEAVEEYLAKRRGGGQ
ncbi:MAG: hypothetical protein DRP01_01905 [Archaeoglobales archaeon]|nr:MAG: hypothetical protein DRP01_01905 [Archaeoglobales archaeon]